MAWAWKPDGSPLNKDDFIFEYITAARWNELALYLLDNEYIDETNYNALLVKKGDFITAEVFNAMAAACGSAATANRDDPITAKIFNDLVANL